MDFDVTHGPGRKHSGPDGLSRRPADDDDNDNCDSVKDCVNVDLGINDVSSVEKLVWQPPIRINMEDSRVDKDCVEKLGRQPPICFCVEDYRVATDRMGNLGRQLPVRANVAEIYTEIADMQQCH